MMSAGERGSHSISIDNMKKDSILAISNGVEKNIRLSSFGIPRDLSLGGLGTLNGRANPTKKIYAPNLKVIRNKNVNIKTSKDTSNKFKKFQKERGGRGSGKAGVNLIQTCGLFADGVGTNIKKTIHSSGASSGKRDKNIPLIKPSLIKKGKIDHKTDESIIKEYFGNIDDVETPFISYNTPVKLKNENGELLDSKILDKKKDYHDSYLKQAIDLEDVSDSPKSELFLLQLPNSLPCDVSKSDSRDPEDKEELNAEKNSSKHNSVNKYLKHMKEGQIGKLLKYKSGSFKLLLGGTHYHLNKGMDIGFVQEVVSINTNKEQRNGNMISLGLIDEKLAAIPVWEILLRNDI